ncbi:MAG: class I SAM-dependent methyltransferase, partial [Chloroflexi bacterium]|nr:class I SAM-dependent methyltransferase [Chloroflexota bacterium]
MNLSPISPKARRLINYCERANPSLIVEVGCLRSTEEEAKDREGWSTLYLARWAADNARRFISIDSDDGNVTRCKEFLATFGLYPESVMESGNRALAKISEPIGLLYLDSSSDPRDTFEQFLAVPQFAEGAIVIVDDAQEHAG